MPPVQYRTQIMDHLGLVAGMCKELRITEYIDTLAPKNSDEANVSHGEAVVAMIINGLGFIGQSLHMFPRFFDNKPLDKLIREGIEPEHLNDKVLGRALDKLFELGVSKVYFNRAIKVVAVSGNVNDKSSFKRVVFQHIRSFKAALDARYFVADAALYVAETILELDQQEQLFISRVPLNIGFAKELVQSAPSRPMKPVEEFEHYEATEVSSNYGNVEQCWVLFRNKQGQISQQKTLTRRMQKKSLKEAHGRLFHNHSGN